LSSEPRGDEGEGAALWPVGTAVPGVREPGEATGANRSFARTSWIDGAESTFVDNAGSEMLEIMRGSVARLS
jgi:hypothetical protein